MLAYFIFIFFLHILQYIAKVKIKNKIFETPCIQQKLFFSNMEIPVILFQFVETQKLLVSSVLLTMLGPAAF